MKIELKVEAENLSEIQRLQDILASLNSTQVKTAVPIGTESNTEAWNFAMDNTWQLKTRQRALEILGVIAKQGELGCGQVRGRLPQEVSYQTVRNLMLRLVELEVLAKRNAKYCLSAKSKETYERCPI